MHENLIRRVVVHAGHQPGINLPSKWARDQRIKVKQPVGLVLRDGLLIAFFLKSKNKLTDEKVEQLINLVDKFMRENIGTP